MNGDATGAAVAETSADGEVARARIRMPSLSPTVIAYGVGPVALALLLVFRHEGVVAKAPIWAYITALVGSGVSSRLVERWRDSQPGSARLHARVIVHVLAVTVVIYMTGWGPGLGMAYIFSALADMEQS